MEITKNILNTVKLTDDTLYNLIYDLLFFNALAESKEDIKNGRVITIEESKERMRQKYANFDVR